MKYILAQGAQFKYQWELDVVLTNLFSLDPDADVVCLFMKFVSHPSEEVYDYIVRRYPQVEVHMYEDNREDKYYIANIRPYLWYCYLTEDPAREKETYFQIESDIIFRKLPDYSKIKVTSKQWYGSDCGGYIDYDYLMSVQRGEEIVATFAQIIGISVEQIKNTPGAGAQWIMKNPTADYWLKVFLDCTKLYGYLQPLDSNIQKWTAEMWSQLLNAPYFGIEFNLSRELEFCRPTDNVKMWDQVNILHNAGVIGELADTMFYKGKYNDATPFEDDLSWVRRDKASIKYVEAIKKVVV